MELDVSFKGVEQTQLYSFLQLGVIKKNNMNNTCIVFLINFILLRKVENLHLSQKVNRNTVYLAFFKLPIDVSKSFLHITYKA